MIERIVENPAVPLHWGKAQKGMQASQETDALVSCPTFSGGWMQLREMVESEMIWF